MIGFFVKFSWNFIVFGLGFDDQFSIIDLVVDKKIVLSCMYMEILFMSMKYSLLIRDSWYD